MRVVVSIAGEQERHAIYALRHDVYAEELQQHPCNERQTLSDQLDDVNAYLVATVDDDIVGFVAITPPNERGYSIDKYFSRQQVPVVFDHTLFEVRLLTVVSRYRRTTLAALLMYAALRYVESAGGKTIVAIGRLQVLDIYKRAGLVPRGVQATAGEVRYELMTASVTELRSGLRDLNGMVQKIDRMVEWRLPAAPVPSERCAHGGAFFQAIGEDFDRLDRKSEVISADVLDAWFDPAPTVLATLGNNLAFALKTSPPQEAAGLRRTIAATRGVPEQSVLPGAGSSPLIFAGLTRWVSSTSRVLILDPMYGEYAHVLERLIGAQVDRLPQSGEDDYAVNLSALEAAVRTGPDWVALVNPNSPTGRYVPTAQLERLFALASPATRFWIDETYIDYVDSSASLERYASESTNVMVCKSMSKAYALSGARVAYLCGTPSLIADLARVCPPWAVSLPAQMAACAALKAGDYYRGRWRETAVLRSELTRALGELGWRVVPSVTNFVLCELPEHGPRASALIDACRTSGLFLRNASSMTTRDAQDRLVRMAVKDRRTNEAMLSIIKGAIASLNARTVAMG